MQPLGRGRLTGEGVQCPLTLPIAGFRAQGRLSQLSARSGLMHRTKGVGSHAALRRFSDAAATTREDHRTP
jgi:hypothetical protein